MDNDDYEVLVNDCEVDSFYNLMPQGGLANTIVDFNAELLGINDLEERRVRANELFDMVVMNGVQRRFNRANFRPSALWLSKSFLLAPPEDSRRAGITFTLATILSSHLS